MEKLDREIVGNKSRYIGEFDVASGQSIEVVIEHDMILTIVAAPGAGGSALVEVTNSSKASVEAGSAFWWNWDAGLVDIKTPMVTSGEADISAIRLSATAAAASFSISARLR